MITLAQLWFNFFERKLFSEFNLKFASIEQDFTISPLVYSFLKHKQLSVKAREVIESSVFYDNDLFKEGRVKNNWENLKKAIENGDDINKFMSKNNTEWKGPQGHTIIDYLYVSTGIRHFHLRKNKKGGIGDELVFGICVENKFYALMIGVHHDLYKLDKFKEIIEKDMQNLNFLENVKLSPKLFKYLANNPNHQPNLIYGKDIPKEYDNELKLVKYNIDQVCYTVPFKVYCAYENEISYIEKIEPFPFEPRGLRLEIDLENHEYVIYRKELLKEKQELKRISLPPKEKVLCSTYKQE
ncbi:hypothetical protein [Exercitatus varius]|uniref:Uncharacterized protein n=1 Tax=Exercitatus varius TaxID=67857 RepID=A0AAW6Q933_9PAST|nr:hypothetical protein [Exercitatus varius]MDG2949256.1 hypothetical protein [Exercitatus varius]